MAINKMTFVGVGGIDLTGDTVVETDVASGKIFHKADGTQAVGTASDGSNEPLMRLLAGQGLEEEVVSDVENLSAIRILFEGGSGRNKEVKKLTFSDLKYAYWNSGAVQGGFFSYIWAAPPLKELILPKCLQLQIYNTQENTYQPCFQNLETLYTPLLEILSGTLRGTKINNFVAPKLIELSNYSTMFISCASLVYADLGKIGYCASFINSTLLDAVVLRRNTVSTLTATNYLDGTKIASGEGYIYVPSSLISAYEQATNWVTFAGQFRALESYTDDGTINGTFIHPTN